MAAKKKAATKKRAQSKKASKKNASRKKRPATSKRSGTSRRRRASKSGELPESFVVMSRRVRAGLGRLEKEITNTEARYRKGVTRMLDEVSQQLSDLESMGEERWHKISDSARRDLAKLLRRLEKAVDPGPTRKRRAAGR